MSRRRTPTTCGALTSPNIRLRGGWLYLVAVIDWFSCYFVSWELDQTLEMPFVVTTVQRALAQATPVIWNSDQGSHFASPQYTQLLLDAGGQISMDGKGRASDNIYTERLWRTVKYEEVYLQRPPPSAPRPAIAGGLFRLLCASPPPSGVELSHAGQRLLRLASWRHCQPRPGPRGGRTHVSLACGQRDNCQTAQLPTYPQPLLRRVRQQLLHRNPNDREETVP